MKKAIERERDSAAFALNEEKKIHFVEFPNRIIAMCMNFVYTFHFSVLCCVVHLSECVRRATN